MVFWIGYWMGLKNDMKKLRKTEKLRDKNGGDRISLNKSNSFLGSVPYAYQ